MIKMNQINISYWFTKQPVIIIKTKPGGSKMRYLISFLTLAFILSLCTLSYAQTVEDGKFLLNKKNHSNYTLNKNEGERVITLEVKFNNSFPSKPKVIVAINTVDADKNHNVRYSAEALFASTEGFILKVKTWGNSKILSIGGQWLAVSEE